MSEPIALKPVASCADGPHCKIPEHWIGETRYVPAVIPPDPERDKRVALRRAADAARAGRALDRLLADRCDHLGCSCCRQLDDVREALDYSE